MCLCLCSHLHRPLPSCPHTDGHHTRSFSHECDSPQVDGKYTVHKHTALEKHKFVFNRSENFFCCSHTTKSLVSFFFLNVVLNLLLVALQYINNSELLTNED